MKHSLIFSWATIFIITLASCGFSDDFDQEASFLQINEVSLETLPTQGADTELFKDVWVYANGDLLGLFTPPAIIPVLSDRETTDFLIFAGIRNDGNNTTPFVYPMIASESFSLELVPGETVTKNLTFNYRDDVTFDYLEGFEGVLSFNDDTDGDLETNIQKTAEEARSGLYSGLIELTEAHPLMEVTSSFAFSTAGVLATAYVELDYKNDTDMLMGITATSGTITGNIDHIIIPARAEWNKIYIDLSLLLAQGNIESFKIYIRSAYTGDGEQSQKVYLDNIKYVYF